jgi:hypothetical protein
MTNKSTKDISFADAISHVEKLLDVKIVNARYLGSLRLHFYNYWYRLNLHRVYIYDHSDYVGSIIIKYTDANAATTPLLTTTPMQFISTTNNINLVHELTHGVHFTFVPFYKIPKDLVEVPSMCIENSIREIHAMQFTQRDISRQVALSIADLVANSPDEFNELYEKYACITNAGDVRARMWHFTNAPFKYYAYALGMASTNYSALAGAVRSCDRDVILQCSE